jgi:pilus assembly protein CpaD
MEMRVTIKSLPLVGMALLLSACGTVNRGLESVHQPVVQRSDYVIDLASANDGLAPGEGERLEGWFRSIGLAYGDRIAVDDPSGLGAARGDVATLLYPRGMMVTKGAPITAGAIPAGTVRVVVSRSTATVSGCPDWSRPAAPEMVGSTMSNYGCANNAALAAMVADPLDLVQGRALDGAIDATSSSKAIQSFRNRAPTGSQGLKIESTSKVGK